MTKLEEEIFFAIIDFDGIDDGEKAKAAAEVAKKYIEKAISDAASFGWNAEAGILPEGIFRPGDSYFSSEVERYTEKWLKENGITESPQ